MSQMDYSALINGDETEGNVQETSASFNLTRAVNWTSWGTQTGHSDDKFSIIDKKKNIEIDEEQINVTQEHRAQYIPFEMNRFYDGIDFAYKSISIQYERADGQGAEDVAVNTQYSEDKIRFGWLLEIEATSVAGDLNFEIHVSGYGPDGQAFLWKSQPSIGVLTVIQGIEATEPIVIDMGWQQQLVTAFMEAFQEENLNAFAQKTYVDNAIETAKTELNDNDIQSLDLSVSESNYKVTLTLVKKDGSTLEGEIDLPLESVVVNGSYNKTSKKVTLTLQNGNTIEIDVADLVGGLASEEYVDTQVQAAKDYADAAVANADIEGKLTNYATKTYVDEAIENADIEGKLTDYATKVYVDEAIENADIDGKLTNYATKTYVDEAIENADIDGKLTEYAKTEEVTSAINTAKQEAITHTNNKLGVLQREEGVDLTVKEYVDSIDISDRLGNLGTITEGEGEEQIIRDKTVEEFVNDKIGNLGIDENGIEKTVKQYADEQVNVVKTGLETLSISVNGNAGNINTLSTTVGDLQTTVNNIDKSPRLTYDVIYNDPEIGENVFVFYEIENEGREGEKREEKKKFTISGGTGTGSGAVLKIGYITTSPLVVAKSDKAVIKFTFSGTDSSGDVISDANSTWKVNGEVVSTGRVFSGDNEFDVTDFIPVGDRQKVVLEVKDESGNLATKVWYVQKIDVRIESNFNDKTYYPLGPVPFTYTPYGAISKTVHFVLDGVEIGQVTNEINGLPQSFTIPAQEHGAHLLEAYITATVNNNDITTDKIVRDIIWYDKENETNPVISTRQQKFSARQYETVDIDYYIYEPSGEKQPVTLTATYIDPTTNQTVVEYSEQLTYDPADRKPWKFKSAVYFKPEDEKIQADFDKTKLNVHTLIITCNDVVKTLSATITSLGIPVTPITANLAFDFNPAGRTNDSADRIWTQGDYKLEPSKNFDWINGGYKQEKDINGNTINGTEHFCIKAGTTAELNYQLFANDPRADGVGKAFKLIFKTKNIKKRDTVFLSCLEGKDADRVGLEMKVENATIYGNGATKILRSDYSEDDIIEYEFIINPQDVMPTVMAYEDGTPSRVVEYSTGETGTNFKQVSPVNITIGSKDCDVLIYRMKAYDKYLTDADVLKNFIADARDIEEMIDRYERNQIYNSGSLSLIDTTASGGFNATALMNAAPDLRYIFLEAPRFTNDNGDKVDGCTVYFRYPAGTRPEDNWKCVGVRHRGQGTSSNSYGYAGRNMDLCMDRDESKFSWVDENGETVESSTITLTENSVPTDYLNIKVNIASSENTNNAEMVRRFNQYQPFLRYARKKNSKVKDTMEFYNCVVFIREASTDATTYPHQEFNDTNWHFYAIGNVGDSKKTDDTRVNNKKDPKEHVIEIMDVDVPLASFPRLYGNYAYKYIDITGAEKTINFEHKTDEWTTGNTAYDILYSDVFCYDDKDIGAFKSFGGKSFEFRYEMSKISDKERMANINTWRNFYDFVATATDEEFYANLKDYFVVDSALYYYLFTERYTMVDNRAKNSFWHYGKVYISEAEAEALGATEASYYMIDNDAAAINEGYRYDLTFGYDFDTSLGIDNTGDYVFSYGKEDTDVYNGDEPVFRAADSAFFCRLRDLFSSEMRAMYNSREGINAWNADSLITQWDNAQKLFPEELWRLDYERKYYRPYANISIDNSIPKGVDKDFLLDKFFGRKRYARRSYELNQDPYFGTKYFGNNIQTNQIWLRGHYPTDTPEGLEPNYSLELTPYQDMYLCVQYGSTGTPEHSIDENGKSIRIKAGKSYTFAKENATTGMDFIYIYAADRIQAVGDLSRCYVGNNSFAFATRLQKLEIGNSTDGYANSYMSKVELSNSPLLEYLDLSNVTGFIEQLELGNCFNLKTLYAQGSNIPGVRFANQGALQTAKLPAIGTLEAKNLYDLTTFELASAENLSRLVVENTPGIDTKTLLEEADKEKLSLVRLTNINWALNNGVDEDEKEIPLLNKLYDVEFKDGQADGDVVLEGTATVNIIRSQKQTDYNKLWPKFDITPGTTQKQFVVTFVNHNGEVLDTQYIDQGGNAVNPITRGDEPIEVPTKDSTVSTIYTFSHWLDEDYGLVNEEGWNNVQRNITMTAQYTEAVRQYTVQYINPKLDKNEQVLQTTIANYGDVVSFTGDALPAYKGEEGAYTYYLFSGWDQSGYVSGDKIIKAQFDSVSYIGGYFDNKTLVDLTPVELYMLTRLIDAGTVSAKNIVEVGEKLQIHLGEDFDYEDIVSEVLAENKEFNGSLYEDTGIALMSEDRDFVVAIDYEFYDGNYDGYTLIGCYDEDNSTGFKLVHSAGDSLVWTGNNSIPSSQLNGNVLTGSATPRQMMIIRHKAGELGAHIYTSNVTGDAISYATINGTHAASHDATLVFGARKVSAGRYEDRARGKIHKCKIWYADLGDEVCRDLAKWPHETLSFEVCFEESGNAKYYQTSSGASSLTFLADLVLPVAKKMNSTNNSTGGWSGVDGTGTLVGKYLQNRIYKAITLQQRQLVKNAKVFSSVGNGSTDIGFTYSHLFVPAAAELYANLKQQKPYGDEGTPIKTMVQNTDRACSLPEGGAVEYWTRSPYVYTSTGYYWYTVKANGEMNSFATPQSALYIRPMFTI